MDATDPGGGQVDLVDALGGEEALDRGLVEEVQLGVAGGEQVAVAQGRQPPHQGRADHAAMAGDVDDLIPLHGSVLHREGRLMAMRLEEGVASGHLEVLGHHLGAQLPHGDLRDPAQALLGLGGIAEEGLDLGGAEVARVDADDDIAGLEGGGSVARDPGDDGLLLQALRIKYSDRGAHLASSVCRTQSARTSDTYTARFFRPSHIRRQRLRRRRQALEPLPRHPALGEEDDPDGGDDDQEVIPGRVVLDIPTLHLALVGHDHLVIEGHRVRGVLHHLLLAAEQDGTDPRQPRAHLDQFRSDRLGEGIETTRRLRPRPGDAHVAQPDVEQLRQLVDLALAQPAPHRQYPRIVVHRQLAGADVGAVLEHGRELEQVEGLPPLAHPRLAIKDLALPGQAQDGDDNDPQRQDPGDEQGREQKIGDTGAVQFVHGWVSVQRGWSGGPWRPLHLVVQKLAHFLMPKRRDQGME